MKGIGVSPGIIVGKVFIRNDEELKVEKYNISQAITELDRLNSAIEKTLKEIDETYKNTMRKIGEKESEIFIVHKMMVEDPEFIGMIKEKIQRESINAEWAVKEVRDNFVQILKSLDNDYLSGRSADILDVSNRLLMNLLGSKSIELSKLEECIIVSEDLTPSDIVRLDGKNVLGAVTEIGGKASHTSIMAKTLELPTVVGVKDITLKAQNGDTIIVDGNEGIVILNPTKVEIDIYSKKKRQYEEFIMSLNKLKGKETTSKDGIKVRITGNIAFPKDIDKVIENDGEGVGLYRTELLYMDRAKLPTEEEQFQAYKVAVEKLDGKPLIIRTLDVGGDKDLPYLDLPKERNPFLGYRAIRICLDRRDIFKTQLRAILRASAFGNIKIIFPMISNLEEIINIKTIIEEVKEQLKVEGISFNKDIQIGIMVETPAAAIQSDILAREVDFFSIGTNDLIQYTLAVDRENQDVSYLYSQYHPAVLRLVKLIIDNGHRKGIWVGMCGEAARDEKLIPILLGMGLDEFSMSFSSILKTRWIISNISRKKMEAIVSEVLKLSTSQEVEKYIEEKVTTKY